MIEFSALNAQLEKAGATASLRALVTSPTSRPIVGVLAERSGLRLDKAVYRENYDLFTLSDIRGHLKSPFAILCVDPQIVDDHQAWGVQVDHELRAMNIFDRPTLVLMAAELGPLKSQLVFSDHPLVFISLAQLIEILTAHPPRQNLVRRIVADTPIRLLNPYVYRGPIGDPLFVGRQDDLKLLTSMAASYFLVGPRSIGKTSLINRAYRILRQRNRVALRVEFSSAMSETDLLTKLIRQFIDSYGAWSGFIDRVSPSTFEHLVEYSCKAEKDGTIPPDRRVILFVDEADELVSRCPAFSESIRRLHNEGRLRFVLVGYKTLRRNISDGTGVLYNLAEKLNLSSISLRECGALVLRPCADIGIEFDNIDGVAETLFEASGGAPSRIQLFCHALVNSLTGTSQRRITVQAARQAANLPEVREELAIWYRASTTEIERAIAGCSSIMPPHGLPAQRDDITRYFVSHFPISADQVAWEIQDLIIADVFRETTSSEIQFTFPRLEAMVRPAGDAKTAMQQYLRSFKESSRHQGD